MVPLEKLLKPREQDTQVSGRAPPFSDFDRLLNFFANPGAEADGQIQIPVDEDNKMPCDKVRVEAESLKPEEPVDQGRIEEDSGSQACSVDGSTFSLLVMRFEELELQMKQSAERAKAEAGVVNELKNLASGIKAHAEGTDRELELAKSRAAAAEARAEALQGAYDAASSQSRAAENLVSQFEQAISTYRKNSEAQRSQATCRKCGLVAEVSDYPSGRRSATVRSNDLEASCALLDSPEIQKGCKYLNEAISAKPKPGSIQSALTQSFDAGLPRG